MARLHAIEAAITEAHKSPTREAAIQNSTNAASVAVMGVQSPKITKIPSEAAMSCGARGPQRSDPDNALRASC